MYRIYAYRAGTMVDGLPRASRFMVHMVVGFLVGFRISGVPGFSSDFGLPIWGIIRNTHLMLLDAWVIVLELARGSISQHVWFTWSFFI